MAAFWNPTGLDWLVDTAASLAGFSLDALCDTLLEHVGGHCEDDVALLALRVPAPITPPDSTSEFGNGTPREGPSEL